MPKPNGYSHHSNLKGIEEGWTKQHDDGSFTLAGYQQNNGSKHYITFVARVPVHFKNFLRGMIPLMSVEVDDHITLDPHTNKKDSRREVLNWIDENPDGLQPPR